MARSRVRAIVAVTLLGALFLGGVLLVALLRPDILGVQRPVVTAPEEPPVDDPASATEAAADPATAGTAETATPAAPVYDIRGRTRPPTTDRAAYIQWAVATYLDEEKWAGQRFDRAQAALADQDIRSEKVLEAFLRTPRHEFSRQRNIEWSYESIVLDLGYGQTMSGPHLQSRMTSFLDVEPDHRVLEIGTGSGVQAAYLAQLSNYVYTIEIVHELATETDAIYNGLYGRWPEFQNVHRRESDGYYGWPEAAPFDRIIVTCGIDHIPPELLKELTVGGIMVIPVGPPGGQTVMKVTKKLDAEGNVVLEREDIYAGKRKVIFVPFTATGGKLHTETPAATEPTATEPAPATTP